MPTRFGKCLCLGAIQKFGHHSGSRFQILNRFKQRHCHDRARRAITRHIDADLFEQDIDFEQVRHPAGLRHNVSTDTIGPISRMSIGGGAQDIDFAGKLSRISGERVHEQTRMGKLLTKQYDPRAFIKLFIISAHARCL